MSGSAMDVGACLPDSAPLAQPQLCSSAASGPDPRAEAAVQTEAPSCDAEAALAQLRSPELAAFLQAAAPWCEEALQQNELVDIAADELATLAGEEDGAEAPSAERLTEHLALSDLAHSRGRRAAALAWHPARRGVLAAAYAEPLLLAERAMRGGELPPGAVLLWNYRDPVHPEAVLAAPAEVLALAFHPTQPRWLAGGCLTGQVVLWDLEQLPAGGTAAGAAQQQQQGQAAAAGAQRSSQRGSGSEGGGDSAAAAGVAGAKPADGTAAAAAAAAVSALHPVHVSLVDASHQAPVAELHWLPGLAASRDTRLEAAADTADCTLFASAAADGLLLLWDMRVSTRHRRPEDEPPEWKPVLQLAALSSGGQPLWVTACCRRSSGAQEGGSGSSKAAATFWLGSLEGELALVDPGAYAIERKATGEFAHNTARCTPGVAGALHSLEHSPFLPDALLAVGDWGFVVWHGGGEGACTPVLQSRFSGVAYTCGCWSPSRPGVVVLGRADGRLEAWDLLDCTHQPALVAAVSPSPLTTLAFMPAAGAAAATAASRQGSQQVLAMGDSGGAVRLLELPRTLRRRGHAEARALGALLAREARRLAFGQQRAGGRAAAAREAEVRRRAEAAAAQGAAGAGPSAGGVGRGKVEAGEGEPASPEQRYQLVEARWRAALGLPPAGGGGAQASNSADVLAVH